MSPIGGILANFAIRPGFPIRSVQKNEEKNKPNFDGERKKNSRTRTEPKLLGRLITRSAKRRRFASPLPCIYSRGHATAGQRLRPHVCSTHERVKEESLTMGTIIPIKRPFVAISSFLQSIFPHLDNKERYINDRLRRSSIDC